MEPTRIIVADAHDLVAVGIAARLADAPDLSVVGHARTGKELVAMLAQVPADLALLEVSLPEMDGIDTMRHIHKHHEDLKVLAHSQLTEIEYVNSMLVEGAAGYVVKGGPKDELVQAIRTVMEGGCYLSQAARDSVAKGYRFTEKRMGGEYMGLTSREREIIRLVALEYGNTEIADALHISEDTVKTHRKNLMHKLNVRSVAGLVKYAVDRRWV
jgi:DNA-binding NarL/FixJ family response regulator